MELIERYRAINESFPRKLYFHLGANAGFFSEFNNMLLAMLYCLEHRIQFTLYSADANFRVERGWDDFFEPFCPETDDSFHHEYNRRWLKWYHPGRKLRARIEKRRRGFDLLTHDVWRRFKNERFAARRFSIPELGIEGGILDATRVLHSIVWRYNEPTRAAVEAKKAAVGIEPPYVGLHIRAGDKVIEHEVFGAARYVEAAERLGTLRRAFVLTDDYSVFEGLRKAFPSWEFRTTCDPKERGYYHEEYQRLDAKAKADKLMNLFAAMDLLAASERFVGTFSSNPGMNMGMRMAAGRVHGVDYESWKIRW